MNQEPVARFAELIGRPDGQIDLAAAALEIARAADPDVVPDRWLAELDRLAEGVGTLDALLARLFVQERFTGNTAHYEDPANSFLDRVLQRRTGIPITLAAVAIEVGRRAGVPLVGIGMPGHFLVRDPDSGCYLDAFDGGRRLDVAACEARFRASTGAGPHVVFGPDLLPVTGTRQILARMLANLRGIYARRGTPAEQEWVLRMRLALQVSLEELLELAHAMERQGRHREAAAELDEIADLLPQHAARLRAATRALRSSLN